MNLLFAVGCNTYDNMQRLGSAEHDAKRIHEVLIEQSSLYSSDHSRLLLSPTRHEFEKALEDTLPLPAGIDTFTLFFAGHGGVTGSSFHLCLRDTKSDRLSHTGYGMARLFSTICETKPPQVNIVVDACQAGGAAWDLSNLLKPEIIDAKTPSSVAFLGACTSLQEASEEADGGIFTTQLLACVTGSHEIQRRSPYLDLVELGNVVSPMVIVREQSQRPVCWGLSLFGKSEFSQNPYWIENTQRGHFPVPKISAFSPIGLQFREKAENLWELYQSIETNFNSRRLHDLLASVSPTDSESRHDLASGVMGLSEYFSTESEKSRDLHAPIRCIATCAVALFKELGDANVDAAVQESAAQIIERSQELQKQIIDLLDKEPAEVLIASGFCCDLFYLPIRISHILGWIGADILLQSYFPQFSRPDDLPMKLAERLINNHSEALACVSDDQAAPLYVFLVACLQNGSTEHAKIAFNSYYLDFCMKKGNIARCSTDGKQAVKYILSLSEHLNKPTDWHPANPSQLLPVLLLAGFRLGLSQDWTLRDLDRLFGNYFIPSGTRDFAGKIIENGVNHSFTVGAGVWKMEEFIAEFEKIISGNSRPDHAEKLVATLTMLSSLLFPDRIAYLLDTAAD